MANESILDQRNASAFRGRHLVQARKQMRSVLLWCLVCSLTMVELAAAQGDSSFESHRRSQESTSARAAPDPVAQRMNGAILGKITETERCGGGAVAEGSATVIWILNSAPRTTIPRWPGQSRRQVQGTALPLGNEVGIQEWPLYPQGFGTGRRRVPWGAPHWGMETSARTGHGLYVPQ